MKGEGGGEAWRRGSATGLRWGGRAHEGDPPEVWLSRKNGRVKRGGDLS